MTTIIKWVVAAVILLLPATTSAQFGMLRGSRFAASAGLVLPLGGLDKSAKDGFDIAIRTESGSPDEPWGYGGTFSYTRLAGRDSVLNYQFFGWGGQLVHHSTAKFYQFAGFGINTVKRVMSQTSTNPYLGSETRSEVDFGLSGGVGVSFGSGRSTGFIEFGVTNIFGDQTDYSWFPLRFGVRF